MTPCKLPSIGEKSRFLRNLDPEVDNMIYLPEDPQSDFEFIAVRSHGGVIIIKVVLTSLEVCVQHATPSLSQVVLSVCLLSV